MGLIEFIQNHLEHVLPILLAGAFGLAIILERYQALFLSLPMKDLEGFFRQVSSLVMTDKIPEAIQLCDQHIQKPVAKIVKTGLLRAHLPETVIEDGLQIAMNEANDTVMKRTTFLATIANVATLLGLLGTIAGLIQSFEAVGHADPQQKAALLSAGISTAMNATMLGLGVAIPCMIAFSFLTNRANRMVSELDSSAVRVMDILKQRFYSSDLFKK